MLALRWPKTHVESNLIALFQGAKISHFSMASDWLILEGQLSYCNKMADSDFSPLHIYVSILYSAFQLQYIEHLYSEEKQFCNDSISDVATSKLHISVSAVTCLKPLQLLIH